MLMAKEKLFLERVILNTLSGIGLSFPFISRCINYSHFILMNSPLFSSLLIFNVFSRVSVYFNSKNSMTAVSITFKGYFKFGGWDSTFRQSCPSKDRQYKLLNSGLRKLK